MSLRKKTILIFAIIVSSVTVCLSQPLFSPAPIEIPLPDIEYITVADFNNDGAPDIAALNNNGYHPSIMIYLMQSSGWYSTGGVTHFDAELIKTADFDHDGNIDILLNMPTDSIFAVLPGNGNGTFNDTIGTWLPSLGIHGEEMKFGAICQINQDSFPDIVYGDENHIAILRGFGTGEFSLLDTIALPAFINEFATVGDFDEDGSNDLIIPIFRLEEEVPDSLAVFHNDGTGHFARIHTYPVGTYPFDIDAADFDGDSYLDLVCANLFPSDSLKSICFLKGNGNGTFRSRVWSQNADTFAVIQPIDLNGQGDIDLVGMGLYGWQGIAGLTNNGGGNFGLSNWAYVPSFLLFAQTPEALIVDDFDGDSRDDVALPRYGGTHGGTVILKGGNNGTLQVAPTYNVGLHPGSGVAADFNDDTYDDLATANVGSNSLTIILNNGHGELNGGSSTVTLASSPYALKSALLNEDTNPDLIISCPSNRTIVTVLGNGIGGFPNPRQYTLPFAPGDFITGDFNEDNRQDVVTRSGDGISLLFGDGAGYFSSTTRINFPDSVYTLAVGDFNEDSNLDLAVSCLINHAPEISILLGQGNGSFGARTDYTSGLYALGRIGVKDVNNDGHEDIILIEQSRGEVFLGSGLGNFDRQDYFDFPGAVISGVSINDFSGDGIADIALNDFIVIILKGDGTGNFVESDYDYIIGPSSHDLTPSFSNHNAICQADFNRDGVIDLVSMRADSNFVSILYGKAGFTHDVAVISILSPSGTIVIGEPVTPKAIIANMGQQPETFDVIFSIGSEYTNTIQMTLDVGQQDTAIFQDWEPTQAGAYQTSGQVVLAGDENTSNDQKTGTVSVSGSGTPIISRIAAPFGGNMGWVTTTITGQNFENGATAKLVADGLPDIIASSYYGQTSETISSTEIRAVFNLREAETGSRHLIVTNPGGTADTLGNAFLVESGRQELWLDVVGRHDVSIPIRPQYRETLDVELTYDLYAGNRGNFNLDRVALELNVPTWLKVRSLIDLADGDTLLFGDSLEAFNRDAGKVGFWVIVLKPGQIKHYKLNTVSSWRDYPYPSGRLYRQWGEEGPSIDFKGSLVESAFCFGKSLYNSYQQGDQPQEAFEQAGADALESLGDDLFWQGVKVGIQILFPWTIPFIQAYDLGQTVMSYMDHAGQLAQVGAAILRILFGFFLDPNMKIGPYGFGPEGFIVDQRPFQYEIHFENIDSATMAVPTVIVTDTLDQDLNWATLRFGDYRNQPTLVEFDSLTGVITWTFQNINLPPNHNPPEGESWFDYTIWPDSGLPTGTQIANRAWIVFRDSFTVNEPESTRMVLNTIDNTAPRAQISQLAEIQNQIGFPISWSGTDSGSGIASYQIYYRENTGPYRLWATTDTTNAIFIGKNGARYDFFCLPIDNVGLTEPWPDTFEVSTIIDAPEGMGVSPNPFVPSRGHELIYFYGGSVANATIKIYDKAGTLVQTLHETAGIYLLEWDATNDKGDKLASGVYIWVSSGPSGNEKGKFAIIR